MQTEEFEDVLRFWFPSLPDRDRAARVKQWDWWFRGGGDAEICDRFTPLLAQAIRGELDDWSQQPQSRLALILVLDQFSRTIYRGDARSYAQDEKACTFLGRNLDGRSSPRLYFTVPPNVMKSLPLLVQLQTFFVRAFRSKFIQIDRYT